MKRLRARPDGVPRAKQRRRCPKCGRALMMESSGKGSGGRTWNCHRCVMAFRYEDGELLGFAKKSEGHEKWYGQMGRWRRYPEGMLVTYGGEED